MCSEYITESLLKNAVIFSQTLYYGFMVTLSLQSYGSYVLMINTFLVQNAEELMPSLCICVFQRYESAKVHDPRDNITEPVVFSVDNLECHNFEE